MKAEDLILYTDMDGTALTDWRLGPFIPQFNITMIKRFIDKGGLFSVASGRQYQSLMKYFPEGLINAPVVCVNGAMIKDPATEEVLFMQKLPDSYVAEAVAYSKQQNACEVSLLAADETAIWHVDLGARPEDADGELRRSMSYDTLQKSNCLKLCFVVRDPARMEAIQQEISEFEHADLVTVSTSGPHFLDIVCAGISKATSTRRAMNSVAKGRMLVCIGDFYNDLEMLKNADIAACPANSPEDIRNVCNYICCSNNHGAVGDLIEKLYCSE